MNEKYVVGDDRGGWWYKANRYSYQCSKYCSCFRRVSTSLDSIGATTSTFAVEQHPECLPVASTAATATVIFMSVLNN